MRKLLSVSLVFLFVLSLAACSNKTVQSDTNDSVSALKEEGDISDSVPASQEEGSISDSISASNDEGDLLDSSTSQDTSASDTDEVAPEEEPALVRPPASAELSGEWNSYQFELQGKIYTLPILYSQLEADGWSLHNKEDREETLKSNQYILSYLTLIHGEDEDTETGAQFSNFSKETLTLPDCYVTSISIGNYSWNENAVLYFPGGISIGSTQAEVEALYGKSAEITESSATTDWTYRTDNYGYIIFTFTNETGTIERMRMSNNLVP